MANTPIFRPLGNNERIKPKGQLLLQPEGFDVWIKAGDYDEVKWSAEIEENEVYSNEFPEKSLALVDVTKAEPTFSLTARMLTAFLTQVALLSEAGKTFEQDAAADQTKTILIAVDQICELPHREVTVESVKCGIVEYVAGTHYKVDAESGNVEILAHPNGVVVDMKGRAEIDIKYSAAAVVGKVIYGLMSKTNIITKVKFIQNQKWGRQLETVLHRVQLRPDGDIVMGGDGDEFGTVSYTGRCYADTTQPAGCEIGTVYERTTRLAA